MWCEPTMSCDARTVILIPAHNEAATIAEVVRSVAHYGTPLVVDDGSTDDTGALARGAGAEVLRLDKNVGYAAALNAGFAEADRLRADVVATFDADGQFDAVLLGDMLAPILMQRADLVLGQRPHPARFAEMLFGLYSRLRLGVRDPLCGLKAYRMALYRAHGCFDGGRSVGTELAITAIRRGARFETVEIPINRRRAGPSRFGRGMRANGRILTAMRLAIAADLRGPPNGPVV